MRVRPFLSCRGGGVKLELHLHEFYNLLDG
jgi:hypothetical protein